jgi:hypothetical protein
MPAEGTCATYQIMDPVTGRLTPDTIEQTRAIIEDRINATGLAGAVVHAGDDGLLRIGVPEIGPADQIAREIWALATTQGVLAFMPIPPELQWSVHEGPLPEAMLTQEPLFTGTEIDTARLGQSGTTDEIVVSIELKETGARLFDEFAAEHLGEQFAVVFDDEVLMAPVLNATSYGGQAQISGGSEGFTLDEAARLVTVLRFGSLPLEVREIAFGACGGSGDLMGLLPARVGNVELVARGYSGPEALAMSDEATRAAMLQVLDDLGRGSGDYELAMAHVGDESATAGHVVIAYRVPGVPAEALMKGIVRASHARHDRTLPLHLELQAMTIGAREVYPSPASGVTYAFFYPYGDVLFLAYGIGDVSMEEALDALP